MLKTLLLTAASLAAASEQVQVEANADSQSTNSLRRQAWEWGLPSPSPTPTPTTFYTLTVTAPPVGADTAVFGTFGVIPSTGIDYTQYTALIYVGTNTSDSSGEVKFWGPKPTSQGNWRLDAAGKFTATDWSNDLADLVSPFIAVLIVRNGCPIPNVNGASLQQLLSLFNWNTLLTYKVIVRDVPFTCQITTCPRLGTLAPIEGYCTGLPDYVDRYRLAVYVRNSQGQLFGSKPQFGTTFPLNADGSFRIFDWSGHPNDIFVSSIVVVLLPNGYRPKDANGQLTLHNSQISYTLWYNECYRVVSFSPTPTASVQVTRTPSVSATASVSPSLHYSTSATPTTSPSPTLFTPTPTITRTVSPSPGSTGYFTGVVIPPIGSTGAISGYLVNLPGLASYWSVCLYVQSQVNFQWYGPKPQYVDPSTGRYSCFPISADGAFSITNWATDPLDATVDTLGLFVVPYGARPLPKLTGQQLIPQALLDWSVVRQNFVRTRLTTISALVPPRGSVGPITGVVSNPVGPPSSYVVAVYVFDTTGWYGPKPNGQSTYALGADYTFVISNWASVSNQMGDSAVPIIAVFLLPANFQPPSAMGLPTLPQDLLKLRIDAQQYSRN